MKRSLLVTLLLLSSAFAQDLQIELENQTLSTAHTVMLSLHETNPNDDTLFALGTLEFFMAVEKLGQAWYRYGLEFEDAQDLGIPFLRLPVAANPQPERISYQDFRDTLDSLVQNLRVSDARLSGITASDVAVVLDLSEVGFDFDQDQQLSSEEALWRTLAVLNRNLGNQARLLFEQPLEVRLDAGDVYWVRAYTQLLSSLVEVILAFDTQEVFEVTAHLFFPKAQSPYSITNERRASFDDWIEADTVDLVTLLYLMLDLELDEPQRLASALTHAKALTDYSASMWRHYGAETDDDREWIPNPRQTGVLGINVDQAMVDAWLLFVSETHSLWRGEKLIPHWRTPENVGINLERVFLEPADFNLILWYQGVQAEPYFEVGEMIDVETLIMLESVFGGEFLGFAIWFN